MKISFEISRNKKRLYTAADKGRRGKAFRLSRSSSANVEIAQVLPTIRNRARDMGRNNVWANRAVNAVTKNTVGEGIQPVPVGELERTRCVKDVWKDWAGCTDCDWYGKLNFYGLQELAMRSIVEGGEVLIYRRWVEPTGKSRVPIKLQVLEGDHLDHSRNSENEHGYSRLGVQFDKTGQLYGYWIFDHHPGDGYCFGRTTESRLIQKKDILHAYEILRPGQIRGVPFGVSAFVKMNDFNSYEDAQLLKQKIAACYSVFVLGAENNPNKDEGLRERIEPGMIDYLETGESIQFADPPSVSDYDSYSSRVLQGIASAYGITYEMLTMDYTRVNFTSGRMAKIDITANFRSWQYNMMVPQICSPVWDWFTEASLLNGLIPVAFGAEWTAPRIQQLDPVKEINANISAVKGGMATLSEIIRETGREPEEFWKEYAQDVARLKNLGLSVDSIRREGENGNEETVTTV